MSSPQDRFAQRILDEIKAAGVAEAWYDPQEFAVHYRRNGEEGSEPGIAYLHNIFREFENADDDADDDTEWREQQIARYVRAIVLRPELPETWESVAPLLRPVLRVAGFGNQTHDPGMVPLSRPVFPYVDEFVVIDQPDSMAYVTRVKLADLGVGTEAVFQAARENQRRTAPVLADRPEGPVLMRLVEDGSAYWSSCLLVEGWLAGLAENVGGRPVAFIPDNGGMLLASDLPDTLDMLFEMVEKEYREAPRSMFPTAYTVDDAGNVVPYSAPHGHPLAVAVHRSECLLANEAYGRQAETLEAAPEFEDVFVAGLLIAERPDGSLFSVTTWAEGVDTLLARADYVAFGSAIESFYVRWEAVTDEVAPLIAVEGINPERFRVRGWPPPSTMESLRARATTP